MSPSSSSDRRRTGFCLLMCLLSSHYLVLSTPGCHPLSQMQYPGSTEDCHQAHASRAVLCSWCSPMVMQNSRSCVTGTTATNALVCFGAGAERKHARALGSWHGCCSLCTPRGTCPLPLLPPLWKVSYHSRRPFALRSAMAACVFTLRTRCCICTAVSLQSVSVRGRGAKTDLEQSMRRTPPSAP